MSGHSSAGRSHCQNCGAPLSGPYCSACGQHDVEYHRSLWPILEDSLEGFLHFDGKFFRTVRLLFTKPGFLTKEFIAGRRVSYTQPLRLYIFASFLYFASGIAFNAFQGPQGPSASFSIATDGANTKKPAAVKKTVAQDNAKPETPTALTRLFDRLQKVDPKDLTAEIKHLAPTMAFFCTPLLGLLLSLAYSKSGRVYIEHLIFALHLKAFLFLGVLATGVVQALVRPLFSPLAVLVGLFAFVGACRLNYRAFREVYGEGRWKTIFKMAAVAAAYGIILAFGTAVMTMAAALLVMT